MKQQVSPAVVVIVLIVVVLIIIGAWYVFYGRQPKPTGDLGAPPGEGPRPGMMNVPPGAGEAMPSAPNATEPGAEENAPEPNAPEANALEGEAGTVGAPPGEGGTGEKTESGESTAAPPAPTE